MIIFIVSNMKKLRLGELKTLALTCTDLDPFELAPSLVFLCYVILHWVVGEKEDWINTKESVSFAIPSCLESPSSKTSVLLSFASHPFIVETDSCDYK